MNELSLRDHFAGLAMQSLVNLDRGEWTPEEIAAAAYAQADAMLEERELRPSKRAREEPGSAPRAGQNKR